MRSVGGTQQGFQHPGQKPPEPPLQTPPWWHPFTLVIDQVSDFSAHGGKMRGWNGGPSSCQVSVPIGHQILLFWRKISELFCQTMLGCIMGAYDMSIQSIPLFSTNKWVCPKTGCPSLVHHPFPHDLVQTLKKWNQESWDNLFSAYISTPFIPPSSDSDVSTQILAKWLQGLFLSRRLSLPALGTLVPQENPFGKLWPWEKYIPYTFDI